MSHQLKTSARAQEIREALLAQCDLATAAALAETTSSNVIDTLNEAEINVPTHLVAVALSVRANLQCAADWWSRDFPGAPPMPECFAALIDIALNLPPQMEGESYDTRTGEIR